LIGQIDKPVDNGQVLAVGSKMSKLLNGRENGPDQQREIFG